MVVAKFINRVKTPRVLLPPIIAAVAIIIKSEQVALAGWGCSSIKQRAVTIGLFDEFLWNGVALETFLLVVSTGWFCCAVLWLFSSIRTLLKDIKQRGPVFYLRIVNIAASVVAVVLTCMLFIRLTASLLAKGIIEATWVQEDADGGISRCTITEYSLNSLGRIILLIIIISCLITVLVVTYKQLSKLKK